MNSLSRALGGWLFHLYRCDVCRKSMNIHDGLVLNPKDNTRVIHKECRDKNETGSNYKKPV